MKRNLMFKVLLTLIVGCFLSIDAFAQQMTVKGLVKDTTGEPIIGANVVVKGTTNGTITDFDGKYTLKVSSNKVSFSYVGFKTEIVNVTNSGTYNVNLVSDNELDEVVVIGYGTQRKSDLTGALASISSKDIKNYAVSNASELLTGKAAGVFVAASSGQPGSDAVIRVRGLGTVNDNNPLYVVDGQFMDNISSLNPSDIERMEVLKDASACAIYGSRGSNGVILITTKGGVKGETTVTLDAYVGVKNSYKALNMMNSDQYYNFIMKAYENDASFQNSMKDKFTNQYQKGYNTNWWNEVTRTAFNQNYNLSIRKGTDNSRSSLSLGYVDDQGAIITTEFKRLSLKANLEYDINKFITVGANVNLAKIRKRDAGAIPSFDFIQKADPFTPVISPLVDPSSENYEYNKYAPTEWSYDPNPVAMLELPNRYNDIFNVFGNVFAQIKLYKGLSYRVQYSFERYHDTFKDFRPVYSSTFSEDNLANQESKYNKETQLNNNSAVTSNYQVEQRLNYNTIIGRHKLDAMVAMTYEKNSSEGINAFKRKALGNDEIYQILDAQTAGDNTSGGKETSSMLSYLGRINYVYDDRYLATVNFRADGSSKFNKDNRYGYFPSGSLAWSFSEEEFMKPLKSVLSSGKVRLSWGLTGNNRIGEYDYYALLAVLKSRVGSYTSTNSLPSGVYPFDNDATNAGVVPTSLPNKDLKWETTEQWNAGLDLGFFDERIGITMDIYRKTTRDLLLDASLPFSSGYYSATKNIGKVRNDGLELSLNTVNFQTRAFKWTTNFNISFNKNKVLALSENQTALLTAAQFDQNYNGQSSYIAKVGLPMGLMYGYVYEGTYKYDDFNKSGNSYSLKPGVPHYSTETNTQPGMPKYADLNGDGVVDSNDRTIIGRGLPIHTGGFTNNFEYKGIDLSVFFQWSYGNDIMNANRLFFESSNNRSRELNQFASYANRWTPENPTSDIPAATNSSSNRVISSRIIEDGSYLRLKNVTVGYTFPAKLVKKWKIDKARVYVAAQNLWTCTGYSGYDPEVSVRNSALTPGLDYSSYPRAYSISFGVSLGF